MGFCMLAIVLLGLALAGFILACIWFWQNSREVNSDMMGASISFDSPWFVASIFLGAGLAILIPLHWLYGIAIAFGSLGSGWFFKSFVLDKLVMRRRRSTRTPSA